jgi:hypothetical protein
MFAGPPVPFRAPAEPVVRGLHAVKNRIGENMTRRGESIDLNKRTILTAIAFLLIGSLSVSCKHPVTSKVNQQSSQQSVYAAKLAQNIPKADRNKYYPIGQHWQNPTVFVDLSGIFIILVGQPARQPMSIANLERDLAALPASAWPLGRVVVFAQSARIPVWLEGNPEPDDKAYKTAGKTIEILKSLDLDIVYAPIN